MSADGEEIAKKKKKAGQIGRAVFVPFYLCVIHCCVDVIITCVNLDNIAFKIMRLNATFFCPLFKKNKK